MTNRGESSRINGARSKAPVSSEDNSNSRCIASQRDLASGSDDSLIGSALASIGRQAAPSETVSSKRRGEQANRPRRSNSQPKQQGKPAAPAPPAAVVETPAGPAEKKNTENEPENLARSCTRRSESWQPAGAAGGKLAKDRRLPPPRSSGYGCGGANQKGKISKTNLRIWPKLLQEKRIMAAGLGGWRKDQRWTGGSPPRAPESTVVPARNRNLVCESCACTPAMSFTRLLHPDQAGSLTFPRTFRYPEISPGRGCGNHQ